MSSSTSQVRSKKALTRTATIVAGIIFVLMSSCAPKAGDGINQPTKKTADSGRPSAASNDYQYDNSGGFSSGNSANANNSSNGMGTINNSSGNGGMINGSGNGSGNPSGTGAGNNMAATNTDCYKADAFICKVERLIGEKTNKYRQSRNLAPLALDAKIAFVSRDWSEKQARSGSIGHSGFPSARMAVYKQEFSVSRSLRGENVAMTGRASGGSQDDAAAERVAEEFAVMWWNSSGHRANMLGRFKNLGVGVFKTSRGSWYATQIFE